MVNIREHDYDANMLGKYMAGLNEKPFAYFDEIADFGAENEVPLISTDVAYMLEMLVRLAKPRLVLEIGTGISFSTHFILSASNKVRVISIDRNLDRVNISRKFINRSGYTERVAIIHSDAFCFFDTNIELFDMIFLDATKKEYPKFAHHCMNALKRGGMFVADNISCSGRVMSGEKESPKNLANTVNGIKKFNRLMTLEASMLSRFFNIGDGLYIGIKK